MVHCVVCRVASPGARLFPQKIGRGEGRRGEGGVSAEAELSGGVLAFEATCA